MCVQETIGWYAMVTEQAVVLYSRLHIVASDTPDPLGPRHDYLFVLHVPTTILLLASNLGQQRYTNAIEIYERIQLNGFTLQVGIISFVDVWK
jgi:hypothetical protein